MDKYQVRIYVNGLWWDNSYTTDLEEAKQWVKEFEDETISVHDRLNEDAVKDFLEEHGDIKTVKAEIFDIIDNVKVM
ncbi:MAG TPA: hypothetical protein GX708_02355 [Gallicola sp.]|nr:hypothetical protein [Gallicola sp.]